MGKETSFSGYIKGHHIMTHSPSRILNRRNLMAALAALCLFPVAGAAHADDRHWDDNRRPNYDRSYHHDHGRDNYNDARNYNQWNNSRYRYNYTRINLSPREESRVRRDLQRYYFDKCGSTNWRNAYGCQPVGNRNGWRIGEPLPPHAVVWPLPYSVYYNLPQPSYGTRYVWVDRDLLLLSDRGTILDILLRL
jgi:hypothetical protein